jgi:hypothetical protein
MFPGASINTGSRYSNSSSRNRWTLWRSPLALRSISSNRGAGWRGTCAPAAWLWQPGRLRTKSTVGMRPENNRGCFLCVFQLPQSGVSADVSRLTSGGGQTGTPPGGRRPQRPRRRTGRQSPPPSEGTVGARGGGSAPPERRACNRRASVRNRGGCALPRASRPVASPFVRDGCSPVAPPCHGTPRRAGPAWRGSRTPRTSLRPTRPPAPRDTEPFRTAMGWIASRRSAESLCSRTDGRPETPPGRSPSG